MILKVRNGGIYREDGVKVAVLTNEATEQDEIAIEFGSEAAPALTKFVDQVNSGSFKPRTVVKELEKIAEKYRI